MIKVVDQPLSLAKLKFEAQQVFGDVVKAVVDVQKEIMAINGELHADEESLLLEQGSKQADLWGINLYPADFGQVDWLEFDSMINLRPSQKNFSRGIDNQEIQQKIREIVAKLIVK